MAHLVNCLECGAKISSEAWECPKCKNKPYGYLCSVCGKRDTKRNLQSYRWYQENINFSWCCEDMDKECFSEKCSSAGDGCYRFAHAECLAKVRDEYENSLFPVKQCPLCNKKGNYYECPDCGHHLNYWTPELCKACKQPVKHDAAIIVNTWDYYHKICYHNHNTKICFLATALYGEDSSKVHMLCFFRDEYLSASSLGRAFIALYVRFSPPLARAIAKKSGSGKTASGELI